MKTHHPKLKTTPCPLFSCGFFGHCTQTALSPTTLNPPNLTPSQSNLPPPSPPPPPASSDLPPRQAPQPESESSSSSNTSQSFTQWRFPLQNSPIPPHRYPLLESDRPKDPLSDPLPESAAKHDPPPPPPPIITNLEELFHVAELQLSAGSDPDGVKALHMLERSLVPNPRAAELDGEVDCPTAVMRGVIGYLKDREGAKPATKVLLALCLAEGNRHVAVEAGAVGQVVETLADLEGSAAERALASLELLCTVAEGAAEVRAHALAVPMMVEVMGKITGRGKEYAISVLGVIFGGSGDGVAVAVAPGKEVARAVALAMQGDCSARGRRKGAQLLKSLQENGRLDLTQEGI